MGEAEGKGGLKVFICGWKEDRWKAEVWERQEENKNKKKKKKKKEA